MNELLARLKSRPAIFAEMIAAFDKDGTRMTIMPGSAKAA